MSLRSEIFDVVKRMALMVRDLDKRLKEVELRSAESYPVVSTDPATRHDAITGKIVYRQNGTKAMTLTYNWSDDTGSNFLKLESITRVYYAPDGVTQVRTLTNPVSNNYYGQIVGIA